MTALTGYERVHRSRALQRSTLCSVATELHQSNAVFLEFPILGEQISGRWLSAR